MFFKNLWKFDMPKETEEHKEERLPLEKGDKVAIFIAVFSILLPVVIILLGVIFLLYWVFSNFVA